MVSVVFVGSISCVLAVATAKPALDPEKFSLFAS